jgi:hypothetical protein
MGAVNKGTVREVIHQLRSISEVLIAAPKNATLQDYDWALREEGIPALQGEPPLAGAGAALDIAATALQVFLDKGARGRTLRCRRCGCYYCEYDGAIDWLVFKTEGSLCLDAVGDTLCTGRLKAVQS